jgi:hypothetical protein
MMLSLECLPKTDSIIPMDWALPAAAAPPAAALLTHTQAERVGP